MAGWRCLSSQPEDLNYYCHEIILILDTDQLRATLEANQIDTVINCAAIMGGIELNRTKPYKMFSENISLSESILKGCITSDWLT